MKKALASAFLIGCMVSSVQAAPLVDNLYVLIERPTRVEQACGITKEGLEASAKSALRYNRIGYGEIDKAEAVLYINTHGVNTGSLCAMDEEVQILDRIETVSPKGGKKMVAMKVYCSKATLLRGTSSDIGSRIYNNIKPLVDKCLLEMEERADILKQR